MFTLLIDSLLYVSTSLLRIYCPYYVITHTCMHCVVLLPLTSLYRECIQIFGAQGFYKLYECLVKARYTDRVEDELVIMAQLREIVPNIRDCFLVDQLVFLEKQTEPRHSS